MANLKTNVTIYLGLAIFCSLCILFTAIVYLVRVARPGNTTKDERRPFYDFREGGGTYKNLDYELLWIPKSNCTEGFNARCQAARARQVVAAVSLLTSIVELGITIAMVVLPLKMKIRFGFYIYCILLIFFSAMYLIAVIINTGPYVYVQYDEVFSWVSLYDSERNTFFLLLNIFLVLGIICCWSSAAAISTLIFAFKNNVGYLGKVEARRPTQERVIVKRVIVNKKPAKKTIYV